MRRVIAFIFLLFIAAASVFGQWYIDKPIREIRFVGLENISGDELVGITNPFIGQPFTNDLFLDLQSKILSLRYFDEFKANALEGDSEKNSVIIEFAVKEVPVISGIKISGNQSIRDVDILEVILLTEGDMMSKTIVRMDVREIETLYMSKGYPDVTVDWETNDETDTNTTQLVFKIDEGHKSRVKSVVFSGNLMISSGTLKRKLETNTTSLFFSGNFKELNLITDKNNLETYYWEIGYVDARVVDIEKTVISEEDAEKTDIELTYYIKEGDQYTFGGIEVEGNTVFSNNEIKSKIRLQEGKIINITKLNLDFENIKDLYYNDGYVANVFQIEEQRDTENLIVVFKIAIIEKPRSHVENIIIQGNEKTKDIVLYRELPLNVGDIFYKDKIFEGLRNLYNLNFFENIDVDTPVGSADGLLDLVITVEEGKTTDINFGISFTGKKGTFPLIGFLKWSDINFQGLGQELSLETNLSAQMQNLKASFTENWLAGIRWYAGAELALEHSLHDNVLQDRESPIGNGVPDPFTGHYVYADTGLVWDGGSPPTPQDIIDYNLVTDYAYALLNGDEIDPDYLMEYEQFDITLSGKTGYTYHAPFARLGVGTELSFSLSYIEYDNNVFRPFESNVRENHKKFNFVDSLWLSFSVDDRDNFYTTTSGFLLRQSFKFTGGFLLGSKDFIRSTTGAEAYFKLFDLPASDSWSYKNILVLHSALSLILPQFAETDNGSWAWTDENRAIDDLLMINGMTMAKGWDSRTGLEATLDSWLEVRMPLFEDYLWLDSFFSMTGGWTERESMANMQIQHFQFSFGVGLRSVIPILPIGLYIVKRFDIDQDNMINWRQGQIDPDGLGLDFVFTITGQTFY